MKSTLILIGVSERPPWIDGSSSQVCAAAPDAHPVTRARPPWTPATSGHRRPPTACAGAVRFTDQLIVHFQQENTHTRARARKKHTPSHALGASLRHSPVTLEWQAEDTSQKINKVLRVHRWKERPSEKTTKTRRQPRLQERFHYFPLFYRGLYFPANFLSICSQLRIITRNWR